MADYVTLGVPYWLGKKDEYTGSVEAVRDALSDAGLLGEWATVEPAADADDPVIALNRALAEAVAGVPAGTVPLIFAGDCTSCLGAVKGLEAQHPAVLWYDAHGDFNTPETSPSGFLGGMPLAALVGRGNQGLMSGVGLGPVAETDVIFTDGRNLDPQEGENLHASAITVYESVTGLNNAPLPDKPLYVHFDTDIVNTDEMPAMNYPAAGGPTLDETLITLRRVIREGQIAGVLFSLWNHTLPGADTARDNLIRVVRAVIDEL